MAENEQKQGKTAYSNIKGLKNLREDACLPSLKKNILETKRELDSILRDLKNKEKELTRIKQEARLKEEEAARAESAQPAVEAPAAEAAPAAAPKPAEPVAEKKSAEVPAEPAPAAPAAQPAEKPVKAETPAPEKPAEAPKAEEKPAEPAKPERPSWLIAEAPPKPAPGERQKKIIYQNPNRDGATSRPPYNRDGQRPAGGYGQGQRPPYNRDGRPPYNRDGQRPAGGFGQGQRPPYGGGPRPFAPGGPRPAGPGRPMAGGKPAFAPGFDAAAPKDTKSFTPAKKKTENKDDKKGLNKRDLIKKGFVTLVDDEERMGSRKFKPKKQKEQQKAAAIRIEHAVVNTDVIPIKVLSEKIGITAAEIAKKLFKEGIIKTINESIDFDTAAYIAADIGVELELKLDKTAEETMLEGFVPEEEGDENLVSRPPIVTVMGHVDHGKTSLLDAIRKTNVTSGEAGGITQHIGAYTIKVKKREITFIDTPGHEAFTAMRKRGADVTDIAVLVVAADDGVMPQTIEAINHAKAANVPIVVAINKMDKPTANVDRIKQQLADHEVLAEEWGGDVIMAPVSAHTGEGLDNLLDMILLVADMRELKANPNRKAKGTIIEAQLDKGKGPVASIIVQNGTLRVGDTVVAGTATGKIRAMIDDKGRNVKEAGPSYAVSVLGFSEVPQAGDEMHAVADEKVAKSVAEERKNRGREKLAVSSGVVTLDDVFERISEGQMKGLNIIVKADVQGSVEAVKQALLKLSNEEVKVNVIHGGVGAVTETDVMLASTSGAIVIAFNVRPDAKAKAMAEHDKVDIRTYRIIYDAIEDVQKALKGMLAPKYKEAVLGQAEVRSTFKVSNVGTVAGSYVTTGKVTRASQVRLLRDNVVIYEGKISSLKRFKDDAKEVATGYECGIMIEGYNDVKEGDVIEAFIMEEIKQ